MRALKYLNATLSLILAALTLQQPVEAQYSSNWLAIGSRAKTSGSVEIPLRLPVPLNWKSKEEILSARRAQVAQFPTLMATNYQPSESVFGPIEDGKPWWGTAGAGIFGSGQRSILGPSEESRFIMNPFLLVGLNPNTLGMWNEDQVSEREMDDPSFPFYWLPQRLTFDPANSREMVVYNITDYNRKTAKSGKQKFSADPEQFSLVAYNARDLGFNYIYLDTAHSRNIENDNAANYPVHITQFIHCGGSCGYPGGCNNMSPFTAEIDRCRFTGLPARAMVYLWKDRPHSVTQTPDFTVIVDLI